MHINIFFFLINILILLNPSLYTLTPQQQKLCLLAESLSLLHNNTPQIRKQFDPFPTFKEWAAACDKLPYYKNTGANFTNKGLEWKQVEECLEAFFTTMTKKYQNKTAWLDAAPLATDDFFDTGNYNLVKPFVQKLIIEPGDIVAFRGDLHGDVKSLIAYIQYLQKQGYLDTNDAFKIAEKYKDKFYMIFLGDYVDRGNYGIEVIYTIMRLQIANPSHIVLVRGNHEDAIQCGSELNGFGIEICKKFSNIAGDFEAVFNKTCRMYDFLPVALYLGCNKQFIQCCHGGMEVGYNPQALLNTSDLLKYEWLVELNRTLNSTPANISYYYHKPEDVNFKDLTPSQKNQPLGNIGFLWNDFEITDIQPDSPVSYTQGRGYRYGKAATRKVLDWSSNNNNQVLGVFRAHQHTPNAKIDLMPSMIAHGISKIWAENPEDAKNVTLWPGIVCTFLLGPDSLYGKKIGEAAWNFDAFGILITAEKFTNWTLKAIKNPYPYPTV